MELQFIILLRNNQGQFAKSLGSVLDIYKFCLHMSVVEIGPVCNDLNNRGRWVLIVNPQLSDKPLRNTLALSSDNAARHDKCEKKSGRSVSTLCRWEHGIGFICTVLRTCTYNLIYLHTDPWLLYGLYLVAVVRSFTWSVIHLFCQTFKFPQCEPSSMDASQ